MVLRESVSRSRPLRVQRAQRPPDAPVPSSVRLTREERTFAAALVAATLAVRPETQAVTAAGLAGRSAESDLAALVLLYRQALEARLPAPLLASITQAARLAAEEVGALQAISATAVAESLAASRGAALITGLTETAAASVRASIVESIRLGYGMGPAAELVRQSVGLDARRAAALSRFAGGLEVEGRARDRAIGRRAEQLLRSRAETIARTEIQSAVNAARQEVWFAGRAAGAVSSTASKRWLTAEDERVCPRCAPLDGETVSLDASFSNGTDMPPDHPRCRCTAVLDE